MLKQQASKIFQEYGIPPSVGLAQMALESGRGTSQRAQNQNNYFGYAVYTDDAPGKTYSNPLESVRDYAKLISQDPRYKNAMKYANDPVRMVKEIKKAGYAADPDYVYKIVNTPEFRESQSIPAKPSKQVKGAKTKITPTPTSKYTMGPGDDYMMQYSGIKSPLPQRDFGITPTPEPKKGLFDKLINKIIPQADAGYSPTNYSPANQGRSSGYIVKPGDTLWSIANRYLGAGNRYRELGYTGDPRSLQVGTNINIPQPKATVQSYTPTANYTNAKTGASSYAPSPATLTRPSTNSGVLLDFTPAPLKGGSARMA